MNGDLIKSFNLILFMSFPDHIPQQSLSFLDPLILINNLDALYLLSLKETDGLSEKSIIRNLYSAEEL